MTSEMQKHHPWCNYFMRPFEGCPMCKGLFERYPFEPGMAPGDLMKKHFPENVLRDSSGRNT